MRFLALITLSALAALTAAAVPRDSLEARRVCPNGLDCGTSFCCQCSGDWGCRPKGGVSCIHMIYNTDPFTNLIPISFARAPKQYTTNYIE